MHSALSIRWFAPSLMHAECMSADACSCVHLYTDGEGVEDAEDAEDTEGAEDATDAEGAENDEDAESAEDVEGAEDAEEGC